MIDILIEKTDINATDKYGNNPLSYAFWNDNIEMIVKLISHPKMKINTLLGQNLSYEIEENRRNHYGYQRSGPVTILDLAMKGYRKEDIINLLKQYSAKTKAQLEEEGLLENGHATS
jgi:ankyrin repeat protein